ncbi:LysM peptidoglycan-binding domain-containing protein [Kitasatospora purpeofusca]|uniref:LysM peptidoglycan-binding domain-containing protein n=1 Tax=Kitasatospora purpeofusca TaxID=67352 RepID=UPI00386761E6
MSVNIISRSQWGARAWTSAPANVPLSERTEYFIHYDGGTPVSRTGNAIPRAIESEHLGNGWSGIGYHFVVDQAGNIYEGRGWSYQGAHCPNHNRSGIGVQIAIGGDQAPTDAALRSARALYDEACARTGRRLAMRGHRDGFATECPGRRLYAWVQAGMPAPGGGGNDGGSPGGGTYTVQRGDTLSEIGEKLGISWQKIAETNGIRSPYVLQIGQVLRLPGSGSGTYTVRSGDSLSVIGARLGISWQRIASANGIPAPYVIQPGQVLRLP